MVIKLKHLRCCCSRVVIDTIFNSLDSVSTVFTSKSYFHCKSERCWRNYKMKHQFWAKFGGDSRSRWVWLSKTFAWVPLCLTPYFLLLFSDNEDLGCISIFIVFLFSIEKRVKTAGNRTRVS